MPKPCYKMPNTKNKKISVELSFSILGVWVGGGGGGGA